MDKRWNERKSISLDLIINYPAIGLLRGKAVNISQNGMFIETAATSLCNYCSIGLTLVLPELSTKPLHIQATIIHNRNNGIGVLFNIPDDDTTINRVHQFTNTPYHECLLS